MGVWGFGVLGFGVLGVWGFGIWGLGFWGLGFWGLGFRIQGVGFGVEVFGFRGQQGMTGLRGVRA